MIEANPDLSPAEMKEILKLTAERRGEPSAPEVDPFWNRDFGWGMADAYEAVKLSMHLRDENLTGLIDVSSQVHITNASMNQTSGLYEVRGIAWGQEGSIAAVEGRFGDGAWMQASYEMVEGGLAALERFEWVMAFDVNQLEKGNQTLEVRGLNQQGSPSLSVFTTVMGTGLSVDDSVGFSSQSLLMIAGVLVFIILLGFMFNARADEPLQLAGGDGLNSNGDGILEAELIDDLPAKETESKNGTS